MKPVYSHGEKSPHPKIFPFKIGKKNNKKKKNKKTVRKNISVL